MPQLVKLQDELKDSGFVIISPHAQAGTKDEVTQLLRKYKVNYTVTSSGEVPGQQFETIPTAFLFNSDGKLVERGTPSSLKQKIHDLVQSEPHFLAAGMKYTKLAAVAESLKKTKAYGQILKKIEKDLKGTGPAADEAKHLTERIKGYGKKKLDDAKALESEDALLAQQTYSEVAASWKGAEEGDQASARLKELKGDKDFQNELKASAVLHQILAECEKLVPNPQGGGYNLDTSANRKVAAGIQSGAAALKKKFPDSKATGRLAGELSPYGFKI